MGNKGDRTRTRILDAAYDLFSRRGYAAVSMQELCTACGLSKGGLYRYFDSKTAVFAALLQRLQAEGVDAKARDMAAGASTAAIVDAFLERTRAGLTSRAPNLNIALYEFCVAHRDGPGPALLDAQLRRGRDGWLRLMAYGAERGECSVERPEDTADAILLLLEGVRMANEVMRLDPALLDGVFRQLRAMLNIQSSGEASK